MNRTGAKIATVLAAALLLGATACGGGDKNEVSSSDMDATTATTAAQTASDRADTDLADLTDELDELDQLGGLGGLGGDCLQAASAYATIGMNILTYMGGASTEQIEQLQGQVAALKAEIPAEVRDDFQVFADGVAEYASAMEGVDMSDIMDSDVQDRLNEASEALDSSEMTEAQANLDAYFAENCS